MTRPWRIARNTGLGLAAVLLILFLITIVVVQTEWFQQFVREKIISATEQGTGGKVEVGSLSFNWRALEAVITDFVIHGKEPAGAAPFVRVSRAQVNLRLFTSFRRMLNISFLGVERPETNILVFADGTTNIPEPKEKKPKSDTTVLDTVVDLAVDYFRITDGVVAFNSQKQTIDVRGTNLRAQLYYHLVTQNYTGQISLQPLYVVKGRNTPVVFTLSLPVVIERNRVSFDDAKITTPASSIVINGSLEDLNNPTTTARINGSLALSDLKNLGELPLDLNDRNAPKAVSVDGNAVIANSRITVKGLRVGLGRSNVEASGVLKDPQGNGSLQFKTNLALDELGRLTNVAAHPTGVVVANGTAKLDATNNYVVGGNVEGRDLALSQGDRRIRNVNVFTAFSLEPQRLDLKGVRLSALGGQFTGDASLEEFARYHVNGNLRSFNLQTVARALGERPLPYEGIVSGPVEAKGDLKARGSKLAVANARLVITPGGGQGVPISGRLNAVYNGATNNVDVANSYLELPNSRLNLSGSVNNRLNIDLNSKNLNDLLAAASTKGTPPITLEGGQASFTGFVTGGLSSPQVSGHLALAKFNLQGRRFDSLAADVAAAKNHASVSNGLLRRGLMQTTFAGDVGLENWSPKPNQPLKAVAGVRNGDLADAMVLAGQPPAGYSGALTVDANVGGTIGNPNGTVDIQAVNGTIKDESFDRVQARVNLSDQLITIPTASLTAGPAQVNLAAEFQHPRESLTTGRLHANVKSNQINLTQLRNLQRQRPNTAGLLNLNADITGNLTQTTVNGKSQTEFLLASVNADTSARELRFDGENYGDLNAKAWTTGQTVNYEVTSNFAGSDLKVTGAAQLVRGYPTTADANMRKLPVERLLVLARRADIPARGNLSGTAHVSGTMDNPQGNVDLDLTDATLYNEPVEHVRARVSYLPQQVDVSMFEVISGPSRIELTARYDHPANSLTTGDLQFRINSNQIDLSKSRNVQNARPGLAGILQLAASGAASVRPGTPPVLFRDLNADIGARNIVANGRPLGGLNFKAATNAGRLNFTLDSDLAQSSIKGRGDALLNGDHPLNAELTFNNVTWSHLQPLLTKGAQRQIAAFDAATDGQVTISGPVLKTDQLRGALKIPRIELTTVPRAGSTQKTIAIHNEGPIAASLNRGLIHIDSAHLVGPETDITFTGEASLLGTQHLDVNLNAKTNISLLESFNHDIYSSGNVAIGATVRGTVGKPLVSGKLELQNASFNHVDLPNGISNANGVIVFNGDTATVRNLTAQSGGGKVTVTGFVSLRDNMRVGLRMVGNNVRLRTPQGVSVVANVFLNLTGTTTGSLASGTATINRITYAPQSDIGSILTRSAPPVQAPEAPNPFLENMRLDIRVRTSSATAVQAAAAQNIQLDADLRVRGTGARPSVLGQINVTEGDLVFFGYEYRVSSGTIGFYNPVRIEPVLNISLETQAKGVNVVLNITGPIDNMQLSYTSDPPLQFQEIVQLLAAGKTPTSDPTLLANQPSQPQQSYQQMGETAVVSKALADPVANRLERVFGVSQLKIDPGFTSGSDTPTARVTLQQQIASNITFTYVSALDDPNVQIIRVEWSFNPQWSAFANRDENGIVSMNFIYKKQFR